MALSIVKCPLCEWAFQAHAYQKGGMVRTHFKEAHPDAEAEIRVFELEVHQKRTALREKFGKDFLLLA